MTAPWRRWSGIVTASEANEKGIKMTTYSWNTGTSGDWDTAANWLPATVPNDVTPGTTADVVIDFVPTATVYTVTLAASESVTIDNLEINPTNNFAGTNPPSPDPYNAAIFELDGTLTFAPGSDGTIGGSLQTEIGMNGGTIDNVGTIDGFIQTNGDVLFTGTNGFYVTNWLQNEYGTVTVDTSSIAEMISNTLTDGIFEAEAGATIDLGGPLENLHVGITTIEGPQTNPPGWTELYLDGPGAEIGQWNGSAYVSIETTLTEIQGGGTVDILGGDSYTTTNTLTVDKLGASVGQGLLNLQAGVVTTGGIVINSGIVQGYGTIVGGVANNGTLIALGGKVGGTLDIAGNLTGTGTVEFDLDDKTGSPDPTKATLVLNGASAGQTVIMNGGDTLILATPSAFAGTVSAGLGDDIVLQGITATSAMLNNGTLVVSDGTVPVASLLLSGAYAGESIGASGSVVTFGTTTLPTITGAAAGQTVSDHATISPFANVVVGDPNVNQTETVTVTLSSPANGTLNDLSGGTYDAATGVYTTTGWTGAVTAALQGLVFIPAQAEVAPGQTVTTDFTITDVDTAAQSATNTTTSVITTAGTIAPTITGVAAGQALTDQEIIAPFAGVIIGDTNAGQTETVTVTLAAAADGTLSTLAGGTYNAQTGVYTDTGSASVVSSALNGLVFTPTEHQVDAGQTVTTGFTITDTDTAGASVTNSTASVIVTGTQSPQMPPDAFSGGSTSGILFADTSGDLALWNVQNGAVASVNGLGTLSNGWSVAGTGDFYGTGTTDILFESTNGTVAQWQMQNGEPVAVTIVGATDPTQWAIAGTGDFYGNGTDDILFQDQSTGELAQWEVQNGQVVGATDVGVISSGWSIAAIGQTQTGAGADSIFFINSNGEVADWNVVNGVDASVNVVGQTNSYWSIVGLGDFTGNGQNDLLFRGQNGEIAMWTMQNGQVTGVESIGLTSADWQIAGIGDYNGDGTSDILFQNTNGGMATWEMQNGHIAQVVAVGATSSGWQVSPTHTGVTLPS
jgi:hypothetical protein